MGPSRRFKEKSPGHFSCSGLAFSGAPWGIRTLDIRIRSPLLYPAELREHCLCDPVILAQVAHWLIAEKRSRSKNPRDGLPVLDESCRDCAQDLVKRNPNHADDFALVGAGSTLRESLGEKHFGVLVREAGRPQHGCQVHELLGTKASLLGKLACGAALALLACLELSSRNLERHAAEDYPVLTHQAHLAALYGNDPRAAMMVNHLAPCVRAVREFYLEGRRRSDLVRFGSFAGDKYIWAWKNEKKAGSAVDDHFNIYPIPLDDINNNKNMHQNKGY